MAFSERTHRNIMRGVISTVTAAAIGTGAYVAYGVHELNQQFANAPATALPLCPTNKFVIPDQSFRSISTETPDMVADTYVQTAAAAVGNVAIIDCYNPSTRVTAHGDIVTITTERTENEKDGGKSTMTLSASFVEDKDYNVTRMEGFSEDITYTPSAHDVHPAHGSRTIDYEAIQSVDGRWSVGFSDTAYPSLSIAPYESDTIISPTANQTEGSASRS